MIDCSRFGLLALVLLLSIMPVYATSLQQVYCDAVTNDPTYKKAQADWLSAQQDLPLARSTLLPSLSGELAVAANHQDFTQDAAFATNGGYASSIAILTLTQPILNDALWKQMDEADANVKAAMATFYFAQQDLVTRTVAAYLKVLEASDILRFTRSVKKTFAEEYEMAKQKFDVGLAAIADVYDAQAQYDQAVANEIAQINALENSIEALREITGKYYIALNGLDKEGIPLMKPTPNDIEAWSKKAVQQNYQLRAQISLAEAAKANIGVQQAGHLPTLAIEGQYIDDRQYDRTLLLNNETKDIVQKQGTIGLVADLNIFSGGSVVAATRKARYDYASACAQMEVVYRNVFSTVRRAFLGVISNAAQVRADKQSIISAQSALKAARAGYEVGTRALLDVLDNTTSVFQAKQQYAVDQYAYINNFVALKQAAGTLQCSDVATLNQWLVKPIKLEKEKAIPKDSMITQPRQSGFNKAEEY